MRGFRALQTYFVKYIITEIAIKERESVRDRQGDCQDCCQHESQDVREALFGHVREPVAQFYSMFVNGRRKDGIGKRPSRLSNLPHPPTPPNPPISNHITTHPTPQIISPKSLHFK